MSGVYATDHAFSLLTAEYTTHSANTNVSSAFTHPCLHQVVNLSDGGILLPHHSEGRGTAEHAEYDQSSSHADEVAAIGVYGVLKGVVDELVDKHAAKEARKNRRVERVKKTCEGCRFDPPIGHPSQMYHMGYGGCMDPDRSNEDSSVSSSNETEDDEKNEGEYCITSDEGTTKQKEFGVEETARSSPVGVACSERDIYKLCGGCSFKRPREEVVNVFGIRANK